jgi:hypothetical protein
MCQDGAVKDSSARPEGDIGLLKSRGVSHDRFASNARLNKLNRAFRPSASGGGMISRYGQRAKRELPETAHLRE